MGTGSFESELRYYYRVKTEYGFADKALPSDCSDIYINETDGQPRLIKYKKQYKDKSIDFWAGVLDDCWYSFEVPAGTVTKQYNLDIK
ncbi:MAG: hypothetical protein ACOCRK_03480 [bacterium]